MSLRDLQTKTPQPIYIEKHLMHPSFPRHLFGVMTLVGLGPIGYKGLVITPVTDLDIFGHL